MSRSKKILSLLQFALLLGIIIGIPAALYFCNPEIIENFKSIDKFNAWIADYKGDRPYHLYHLSDRSDCHLCTAGAGNSDCGRISFRICGDLFYLYHRSRHRYSDHVLSGKTAGKKRNHAHLRRTAVPQIPAHYVHTARQKNHISHSI